MLTWEPRTIARDFTRPPNMAGYAVRDAVSKLTKYWKNQFVHKYQLICATLTHIRDLIPLPTMPAYTFVTAKQRACCGSDRLTTAGRLALQPLRVHAMRPVHRIPAARQCIRCFVASERVSQAGATVTVLEPPTIEAPQPPKPTKTRVVLLGSGWAATSFLKSVDPKMFAEDGPYELTLVSPRNYFLYTPLLPAAVSGTVEERSIVEPVRNLIHGKGHYYEAKCLDIDPNARVLTCLKEFCEVCRARHGAGHTDADHTFHVPYDILIVGVGAVNNTFGVRGVNEHCWFLKTIDEAHKLRVHLSKSIEHAGLPTTTPEERRRLLSFVVVGGGPTGCELAAELHDLITEDVSRLFPHLKGEVSITLVETQDHLLSAYDRQIAEYAGRLFKREGIQLKLNTKVLAVDPGVLHVQPLGQPEETLPFGTCVWATGVGMHPLVKALKGKLPATVPSSPTGLVVDRYLRVKGWDGSIIALGDVAVTNQDKALEHAASLFASASITRSTDGRLSESQIYQVLRKAVHDYPQMSELARHLEGLRRSPDGKRVSTAHLLGSAQRLSIYSKHIERLQHGLTYDEFRELLQDMDKMLRALPATAQVARQEGEYMAALFSGGLIKAQPAPEEDGAQSKAAVELDPSVLPFHYTHLGSLAYLGMDRAVMQLPYAFPFKTLKGWLVGHAWRGMETFMQVSLRNQWMVLNDWIRTKLFGRNLSDV